ncbi:MAG TPA: excalibur calcium-binding domain-containing protein [Pseudonocardiaceae bacterium]|nr:excalibur calcium-binding domain-containing protein [Pseudonocardiaceae bacterium]
MVGIVFLVLLAIPALVVWVRARKLTDGSRGLTTSTLIILFGAFILGAALTPSSAPPAEAVPAAPVEQAAVPPATQPLVVAPPVPRAVPAPQPLVQAPPPTAARTSGSPVKPDPPVAPAPRVAAAPVPESPAGEPSSSIYYKNCAAARAAGAAPIQKGEPGYRSALDRDGDGTACDT